MNRRDFHRVFASGIAAVAAACLPVKPAGGGELVVTATGPEIITIPFTASYQHWCIHIPRKRIEFDSRPILAADFRTELHTRVTITGEAAVISRTAVSFPVGQSFRRVSQTWTLSRDERTLTGAIIDREIDPRA